MKDKRPQYRNNKPDFARNSKPRLRIDAARNAAALLLAAVLENGKTLDEAMVQTPEFSKLMGRDRAFCANVVKSSLRYLGVIDLRLSQFLQNPLPDTAVFVRSILRISMGQFFADIAPIHSIIDTAVELSKSQKISFGMKGLVNAVLRRATTAPRDEFDPLDLIPNVWRNRWIAEYGEAKTREIALSLLTPIGVDFNSKTNLGAAQKLSLATDFEGVWLDGVLRCSNLPDGFSEHQAWRNGDIWVQNAAAALPAKLLDVKPSQTALDMCAAPGGKTIQLCDKGAIVTAIDISTNRIKLIEENLKRTKFEAEIICKDAIEACGENKWDKILLDAPCSATGTLRRNPETIWIKNPSHLSQFIATQSKMMKAAAKGLKSGGILVYAVCSMEAEEGEIAIACAKESGLEIDPILAGEIYNIDSALRPDGSVRILPNMLKDQGGLDGFFIARFKKK